MEIAFIIQQAEELLARGAGEEALAILLEARMRDPQALELANAYACVLFHLGRLEEAEKILRSLLECHPKDLRLLNNLGYLLLAKSESTPTRRKEMLMEAIAYLEEARRLHPQDSEVLTNLGIALTRADRAEEALPLFAEAIALDPTSASAHNNRGVALRSLGRLDEAAEAFREALRIQPCDITAANNLGCVERARGRHEEAEKWLRHAAEHGSVVGNRNLALTLRESDPKNTG